MHALVINQQVEKYPYSISQLRKDNPQVSFPRNLSDSLLAQYNVFPVKPSDRPAFNPVTQRLEEGTPLRHKARNPDGTFRSDDPATPENEAWEWLQVWNVVPLTADEIAQQQQALQEAIVEQTQQRLDEFARTRGYDGILSAATYATSKVVKFAAEGRYCVEARDATWARLYAILAEVEAGQRPAPSGFADIENELPALVWPA